MTRRAFTLIELLVCIAIVAMLLGLLLPSLAGAREAARAGACLSNQRQMVIAWTLYAQSNQDRAMPLADERSSARIVYWWGSLEFSSPGTANGAGTSAPRIDASRGFLAPHMDAPLAARSVFECPAQPWGSYRAQPMSLTPPQPTSTYGYNGYFLAPASTPGWNRAIADQRWQRLGELTQAEELLVFADTMLAGSTPRNCALLDPPFLFDRAEGWSANPAPTTSFRHRLGALGTTNAARADGSVRAFAANPEWLVNDSLRIGSVGIRNDPRYVPGWTRWR